MKYSKYACSYYGENSPGSVSLKMVSQPLFKNIRKNTRLHLIITMSIKLCEILKKKYYLTEIYFVKYYLYLRY